ncbi:hypothetical protein [Thermomonospora catenispora]|uniref:hypothetical protein n=1 Tax=Thermomonospora catenispora TaxID=2493090 RepID=UPI00111D3285|nr:hypothetical protein [Thermomonospora catenispora]TNY34527.1 hypothetical protein EIO00_23305 [Thermomonospora catenispora]
MSSSVIWAESPLQLLSAVEAHRAGLFGPDAEVWLRSDVPSLEPTAAEIERLGLPPGLRVAGSAPRPVRPPEDGVWVIGDAFSGVVQRGLLTFRRRRMVIVDDGLATVRLLELLVASRPRALVRARLRPGPARRALGTVAWARLRSAASAGRLTVCTALPISAGLRDAVRGVGAAVHLHDFPWLRSRPTAEAPPQRLVVLGSSLVRNGLVHRDRYLAWVRSLAAAEPLQYRPHRRESADVLDELRADPRISVTETGVPVEISLRGLTAEHRVVGLPSTALTSLRLVLRSSGTRIEGVPVPSDWWTDAADPGLRDHLGLSLNGPELAT